MRRSSPIWCVVLVSGSGVGPSERAWSRFRVCHARAAQTAPLEHGAVISPERFGIHLSFCNFYATLPQKRDARRAHVEWPSEGIWPPSGNIVPGTWRWRSSILFVVRSPAFRRCRGQKRFRLKAGLQTKSPRGHDGSGRIPPATVVSFRLHFAPGRRAKEG